jgi:hypothetical protein
VGTALRNGRRPALPSLPLASDLDVDRILGDAIRLAVKRAGNTMDLVRIMLPVGEHELIDEPKQPRDARSFCGARVDELDD